MSLDGEPAGAAGCVDGKLVFDDPRLAQGTAALMAAGNDTQLNMRKSGRFTALDGPAIAAAPSAVAACHAGGCVDPLASADLPEGFASGTAEVGADGVMRVKLTTADGRTVTGRMEFTDPRTQAPMQLMASSRYELNMRRAGRAS